MKYDNSDLKKCEYIDAMRKVYFKNPKQSREKCEGYKNKYTGGYSKICLNCIYLERGEIV